MGRLSQLAKLTVLVFIWAMWCSGCRSTPEGQTERPTRRTIAHTDGFDDHTLRKVRDLDHFEELSANHLGTTRVLKFVITRFEERRHREIRYLESDFYELHDQWYWFRLMNGQRVPGAGVRPVTGHEFESPDAISAWAKTQTRLPLNMRWATPERLYSDRFYDDGIRSNPRRFGLGALVHIPARPARGDLPARDAIWAFELQYSDEPSREDIEAFVSLLEDSLPTKIASELRWLVRSPAQERLVASLERDGHRIAGMAIPYSAIATPGELEIYNPGIVAGRLRRIPADDPRLWQTRPNDILILDALPDHLPQASAILTAIPQTPLAHLNLLARNRGIPNAYLGGIMDDPNFEQLSRVHAPVIVHAADGELVIEPISNRDYSTWLGLSRSMPPVIERVRVEDLPYTIRLEREVLEHVPELRPVIGGKASGFLALHHGGATMPEGSTSITVRAYVEHMSPLQGDVQAMLADRDFRESARLRYLVLEGPEKFLAQSKNGENKAYVDDLFSIRDEGDHLREIIEAGGLKRMIRNRAIAPQTMAEIERTLAAQFGHFHPNQGLRFRSSSNVEDISGFNGAGLYVSSTGFPHADEMTRAKDRKRTVEFAIKRTWASYWNAEAFEERRLAGIDHRDGAMGVLVHARFDDPKEVSNGVFTYTVLPPNSEDLALLELNVQAGALSVTNPPPGRAVTPEIVLARISREDGATLRIERVSRSSEAPDERPVLDDDQIRSIFAEARSVSEAWLSAENARLPRDRHRRSITLDFEFREMANGWPALSGGNIQGPTMVLKQVRPLEPASAMAVEQLAHLPIPRGLLIRAARIENHVCKGPFGTLEVLEVHSDPLAVPDPGHAQVPFTASVRITASPRRGRTISGRGVVTHDRFVSVRHPELEAGGDLWDLEVELGKASRTTNVEHLSISTSGAVRLSRGNQTLADEQLDCATETLLDSPDAFLRTLLPQPATPG
jgi:hypothetical protein